MNTIAHLARRSPGRVSAASGAFWFFIFSFLIVATLSYKGVGVIKYPASAAKWPVIGSWLNTPDAVNETEREPGEYEEPTREEVLSDSVNTLTDQLAVIKESESLKQAEIDEQKAQVQALQADLAKLNDLIEVQKDAQRAAVAKVFERMEAGSAVKIMEGMLPERVAAVLGGMKDTAAAEILSAMDPARAQLITGIMAGFGDPPASLAKVDPDAETTPEISTPVGVTPAGVDAGAVISGEVPVKPGESPPVTRKGGG